MVVRSKGFFFLFFFFQFCDIVNLFIEELVEFTLLKFSKIFAFFGSKKLTTCVKKIIGQNLEINKCHRLLFGIIGCNFYRYFLSSPQHQNWRQSLNEEIGGCA